MKAFEFVQPTSIQQAIQLLAPGPSKAVVLAGGVDLLGELKERILTPDRVINLKAIPGLDKIQVTPQGLRMGAVVTLSEIEEHPTIRKQYQCLAEAAGTVGSVQIRNQGTIGGNLCQRPRCWYYRSREHVCLKKGGGVCFAIAGENRYHAILGGGPPFIVHPSDCAPALIALGARVKIAGPKGTREVPLENFFLLPSQGGILKENILQPNEILTEVFVPAPKPGTRSVYLKFNEKGTMDFALSSAAVVLVMQGNKVQDARIVLGGVAPIPWRAKAAEAVLKGKTLSSQVAETAGRASTQGATPLRDNAYKVPLTQAIVKRAILAAASGKPGGIL